MKRNKLLYTLLTALFIGFISSCQEDPEIGGTAVQPLAGDWFVQAKDANGNVLVDYSAITTYNTAANSATEMWFDDHFWGTKFKVPVNASALTFAGTAMQNSDPAYDVQITIANGKIIEQGTVGPESKSPTDSIYYEVTYSDDPDGLTYYMSGYRRTGFEEDEH